MSEPPITVRLPAELRPLCGGRDAVTVAAGDVRALLAALAREHAAVHRRICEDTGVPRQHIGLFVNDDSIRLLAGLDTRLQSGDVVSILPAVSGG